MRYLLLALLLIVAPASGEAKWRQATSRHFVIYSEQSESDLRQFADQLERFDRALRIQLRRADPDRSPATRLTIYVLANQNRLQNFLDNSYAAGIYFPRASGSVSFTHRERSRRFNTRLDPQLVLFHEYTHHFLYNNFDFGAPLWFSEGYPEFWSTAEVADDGSISYGRAGSHRSGELRHLPNIPVDRLLVLRHPITDGQTFAAIYGRGWVLAHYLSFEPSRAGQLDAYLRALSEGRTAEEAASVFGDLNDLDREVQSYMRRSRHSYATLSADQVSPGPITVRELSEGEEAIMTVQMRSKRGVTESQARALVRPARAVAERFPNDPAVQVVLAEVEYDAENYAEAEAAADRALAADPNLVDAHLFKARAIWGRLAAAENRDPEAWQEVRRWIGSANRLDPDDPEPLLAFFDSFEASGTPPTQNAIDGLYYAQSVAPEDRSLRVKAARQYLIAGNAGAARSLLGTLTSDSHSGSLGNAIAELMPLLESGDTQAALAQLDAALAARESEG